MAGKFVPALVASKRRLWRSRFLQNRRIVYPADYPKPFFWPFMAG
jgi:hypothetical protein